MKTEALKKAQNKYRREKITSLKIDLYIKDNILLVCLMMKYI